jgi:superfamily II DNA/RNA helicase
MTDPLDLEPMDVYLHKSGRTETPDGRKAQDDDWDLMVTTSALEVGFDHPGIIGTFQYRAPMNIPGFVQRKGRGGREPDDQPISVVVLGSRPEDAFYFHHENLLSDPDDRYLRINLDEQNEFVRIEHMVSAVFDYLNLTAPDVADEVYRRLDIDELDDKITREHDEIDDWLRRAFPTAGDKLREDVFENIQRYVNRTKAPTTSSGTGGDMKAFWEAARMPRGTRQADLESRLDELKFKRRLFEELADEDSGLNIQTDE